MSDYLMGLSQNTLATMLWVGILSVLIMLARNAKTRKTHVLLQSLIDLMAGTSHKCPVCGNMMDMICSACDAAKVVNNGNSGGRDKDCTGPVGQAV